MKLGLYKRAPHTHIIQYKSIRLCIWLHLAIYHQVTNISGSKMRCPLNSLSIQALRYRACATEHSLYSLLSNMLQT